MTEHRTIEDLVGRVDPELVEGESRGLARCGDRLWIITEEDTDA